MIIDSFYDLPDGNSWSSEPDFSAYGDELAFYTEGTVCFKDDKTELLLNTLLLEFVIEVDLILRRRAGQVQFDTFISMQLAGDSLYFSRKNSLLKISSSRQKLEVDYDWIKFIDDFQSLKKKLKDKMISCYPNVSRFKEIEFLLT